MNQMDKINQDLNTKILEIQEIPKTFAEMSDKAGNAFQ